MAKPVRLVGWKKVSDYCITNGVVNVIQLGDGTVQPWRPYPYERWRDGKCEGRFVTAREAKG